MKKIEAKQIYSNGFVVHFEEPVEIFSGPGISTTPTTFNPPKIEFAKRKFICINEKRFNPINFGIDYHKDGFDGCACFWYDSLKKIRFSLYNDNGKVDCSKIAANFGGGGHKGASGFVIDTDNFLKITNGNE